MAKRLFKESLERVPVNIGNTTVLVRAVAERRVHIETQEGGVNVRGVMLACREGFTLEGGNWAAWSGKSDEYNTSVHRTPIYAEATPTMRRVVLSIFRQAADAFAKANRKLLVEAGLVAVNNVIHRLDNEIEDAEKVLNDLLDKRVAALAEERGLEELMHQDGPSPRM